VAAGKAQSRTCCGNESKLKKGAWWMPRLKEAMKDVGSCDNLRLGATGH